MARTVSLRRRAQVTCSDRCWLPHRFGAAILFVVVGWRMFVKFTRYSCDSITSVTIRNVGQAEEDNVNDQDDVSDYWNAAIAERFSVSTRRPAAVSDDDLPRAGKK